MAELCGFDVPDAKSPPPTDIVRALGAIADASEFPAGPIIFRAAPERVEKIIVELQHVIDEGVLAPALSGKIFGKLMFMSSQFFARLGRAMLRAFSRRQHDKGRIALNPQLLAACRFWIANARELRPREIPLDMSSAPRIVSYSDGEGAKAGIGIAVWLPCGRVIAGYIQVPEILRQVWARRAVGEDGERYDIFEVEALGPALILANWGHLFPEGCLWMHYIDNEAALATLVKGSSSVMSSEIITAYTHEQISKRGIWPWFDRVDTHSNPVDQLSRGVMAGPWELLKIVFPRIS